tara:strand:+ start:51 stop:434 length:384 start_codon:yes stop_codon:yes gene_type:complete
MNHEAINKQIADFCQEHYPSDPEWDEPDWHWKCPTGDYVPNLFTSDLNDIHKAILAHDNFGFKLRFNSHLRLIVHGVPNGPEESAKFHESKHSEFLVTNATAAQRAQAFVNAIESQGHSVPKSKKPK